MTAPVLSRSRLDALGVALSVACAAHCVATPLLVAVGVAWLAVEGVHGWLAAVLVPTAALAAWGGWRRHRRAAPVGLLVAGAGLVAAALVLPEAAETAVTLAGSGLLVGGHLANARLRACPAHP